MKTAGVESERSDHHLRKQLRRKSDWEGAIVRLLRDIENERTQFPKGLRMKVQGSYGGRLSLEYVAPCPDCKLRHRYTINKVPNSWVEVVSIRSYTESRDG